MSKRRQRFLISLGLVVFGLALVATGARLTINFLPLPIIGYILIPFGIAGLLGVNIFWGGPWDKRLDFENRLLSPEAQAEAETRIHRQIDRTQRFAVGLWQIPTLVGVTFVVVVLLLIYLGVID